MRLQRVIRIPPASVPQIPIEKSGSESVEG